MQCSAQSGGEVENSLKIAIDRGGTFTDIYYTDGTQENIFKLLSVDPDNYPDAPTEGIRRALEMCSGNKIPKGSKLDISNVHEIRMGTTVATNGLLERKGDRVAFLTTKGFRDILAIGQQARPDIFDLKVAKLEQLYESVWEIDERVTLEEFSENPEPVSVNWDDPNIVRGLSGEAVRIIRPPHPAEIRQVLMKIWESGIRSLAIALLHGYTFTKHEQEIAQMAAEIGFEAISVSSDLQPMIKLVSRAASANADAYLSPLIRRYVTQIGDGFAGGLDAISSKLLFMQSDGGLTPVSQFTGLKAVLSGPAGGVVGYSRTTYTGEPIIGFDMGGTSTDVSRYDGHLEHIFETTTAQVTIQAPQLDIQTVAAGGGSILSYRQGLFVVGPESASAHPGPACYRKGGPLTVTDANLMLGRINVSSFPHIFGPDENEPLDTEIVSRKFHELTSEINEGTGQRLTPEKVALGFLQVANESMARPIRSLTEGKGYEVARHTLASFGGAGGQHACAVARTLGIKEVIIHRFSSVLSAYGIALADIVVDVQRPDSTVLVPSEYSQLQTRLDILERDATDRLAKQCSGAHIEVERYLNLRYKGSETFMMIRESPDMSFVDSFVTAHRREFGFTYQRDILVGDVRIRAIAKSIVDEKKLLPVRVENTLPVPVSLTRRVYFESGWAYAEVHHLKDLSTGSTLVGPALILDDTQTLLIEPDCRATVTPYHVLIDINLEASHGDKSTEDNAISDFIDPVKLSVFGHRFMSIAEQMGQALQKTAISTNIKERLDFSCAIFSPEGGLVANAPHIPVHLGSMSSAVAFQREYWEGRIEQGDVIVANHPAYGGSHLPDLTVITPVFRDGKIVFWAASRGHHSDIGGITAGSMPPFSKFLWQEGARIIGHKIVSKGEFDTDGFYKLMVEEPSKFPGCSGSRSFADSLSDIKAQIAANSKGIELLNGLSEEYTLPVVKKYMYGIQGAAEQSVRTLLKKVARECGPKLEAVDFLDDGSPIQLQIRIKDDGSAIFDFTGTGPQLLGNLNAPRAITYSAILYCLRTMISDDIPLNQGCLKPLDIRIPDGTLLAPDEDAACVGGNVETSQRVTDVVFRAFRAVAGSQGTCNNLTFGFGGNDKLGFGYYETIGGGAGAGPSWAGQSGVQIHMTNTRSTDPEVFEKRYPVILREFSLRNGSGGSGKNRGGDGVIRDIEFTRPVQVSILSERRSRAPYGLAGGDCGAPGRNFWLNSEGKARSLGGKNTLELAAGDRIRIETPGGGGYGKEHIST